MHSTTMLSRRQLLQYNIYCTHRTRCPVRSRLCQETITMTFTSALGTGSSHRYHSRLAGHDLTETQDAAQFKDSNQNIIFDDTGPNTLSFTNCDPSVTVWIKGLQIVRGYGMCQLPCDSSQQCNGGTCNGSGTPCSTNQTQSGSNDLAPRQDYPCNYENCGGMSCTGFFYDDHNGTLLQRGTTYSWTWTNPNASFGSYNSYAGSSHCLFNLNNVTIPSNQGNATTPDIPFQLSSTTQTGKLSITPEQTRALMANLSTWLTESTWLLTRS